MPFSFSKMRNAFCWVFSAVLCFTLPLASKAQDVNDSLETIIAQQQSTQDRIDNLAAWLEYYFSSDSLYEYIDQAFTDLSDFQLRDFWINPGSPLRLILAATTNIASRLNPGHNNPEAIQVEDRQLLTTSLQSLDAVERIYQALMMSTSPNGGFKLDLDVGTNGVEVSDTVTHDKLDNIIGLVDELLSKKPYDIELWVSLVEGNTQINNSLTDIATVLQSSNSKLSDYKQYLEDLVGHTHDLESADQAADSIFNSAFNSAESDTESQEETAASDYESIPMSDVSDDGYVPDISQLPDEPADSADLGLGDQTVGDHNALIRLYTPQNRRDSNPDDPPPIPAVEIDWGRDQVLNQQVDKFSTFFAWFYPILGTGFLSAKALMMFRKCKLATTARAANPWEPPDPYVSLAWDPF